jgi:hypothetical protein
MKNGQNAETIKIENRVEAFWPRKFKSKAMML